MLFLVYMYDIKSEDCFWLVCARFPYRQIQYRKLHEIDDGMHTKDYHTHGGERDTTHEA